MAEAGLGTGMLLWNEAENASRYLTNRSAILLPFITVFTPVPTLSVAQDTGKIVEVYAHPNGQIALRLDTGLPNSPAANTCGFNGAPVQQYACLLAADSAVIKSVFLAAKAANLPARLIKTGNCLGEWQKTEAMHVL